MILNPQFTEEDHRYSDDAGNVYPSTTELIGQYWPIDRTYYKQSGTQRGTDVHSITQIIDAGLFPATNWEADEEFSGYVNAWEIAKSDMGLCDFFWIEQKFVSEELGYAGTVDRMHMHSAKEYVVIDIKTGRPENWHELQLGAYATAATIAGFNVISGYDVYLQKTGKYKAVPANIARAMAAWKGLITWHTYWRMMKR